MKAIELEKAYNPKNFERRIYETWEKTGAFKEKGEGERYYSMVIPPPNVTGVLHAGHALNNVLQDIEVRYHRMKGERTIWITGCDHAGIATQNVVERALKKEGLFREEIGREAFLERTWNLKEKHHEIITKQQRALGNSTDWQRERFTMDEGLSRGVREVFVSLYEKGLIYRGKYLVNWCPRCSTALSDDEVEHEEEAAFMYHIRYEFADSTMFNGKNYIEVATTRPETLFGDVAVAVHPEDERYKSIVGKTLRLPLTNKTIPIIADSYVEREFGTGMVKITPAHDPNDYQVGTRHNLPFVNVLNEDGTMNENCPEKYRALHVSKARLIVIEDLKEASLFEREEAIKHSVGHCYRCNATVEPFLSDEWFVRMEPLAKKALEAWKDGEVIFYPKKWENTYEHWLSNIRDWCISRQLWWGHRIPVWNCKKCGKMMVLREDPSVCTECASSEIVQEEDVLDTWFSSWLWPFTTLGWPNVESEDYKKFFPTTALVTAYDIIFFWVARMIMASLEFTGKVPFRDIYIHGLVRDRQGRKMSKTLGNGIDPLEIIDVYGADALKFTLAFMCAQGQDVLIDKNSFKLGSRFSNKVWNASRYILQNLEGRKIKAVEDCSLNADDLWIYHELNAAALSISEAIESYRFNDASSAAMEYFWNEFCDWYVEATKLSFKSDDNDEKDRAISVLLNLLEENLRLLHPFLPFVTEEIYSKLPLKEIMQSRLKENKILENSEYSGMLIGASYPLFKKERQNDEAFSEFSSLKELVTRVRTLKAECAFDASAKVDLAILSDNEEIKRRLESKVRHIMLLSGAKNVEFVEKKPKSAIADVGEGFEVFILINENTDVQKLILRFSRLIEASKASVNKIEKKLNGDFSKHAGKEAVLQEKEHLENERRKIEKYESYLKEM